MPSFLEWSNVLYFIMDTCTSCEYEKVQKPDSCNHWRVLHCKKGAMQLPQKTTMTVESTVSVCAARDIIYIYIYILMPLTLSSVQMVIEMK
jgi:hypothetical protein